jgi:hypothetical protein
VTDPRRNDAKFVAKHIADAIEKATANQDSGPVKTHGLDQGDPAAPSVRFVVQTGYCWQPYYTTWIVRVEPL